MERERERERERDYHIHVCVCIYIYIYTYIYIYIYIHIIPSQGHETDAFPTNTRARTRRTRISIWWFSTPRNAKLYNFGCNSFVLPSLS